MASFLITKDHTVSFTRHHCQIPSNPAFSDPNHQARRRPRSSACVVHELHKNQNPRPRHQDQSTASITKPITCSAAVSGRAVPEITKLLSSAGTVKSNPDQSHASS
ncbi:hypothetical protein M0R45_006069 [Rubus argutus]|uniref:Uncharacterized protein n=1 Tax=Rubus argutus TaxID=59490 RepID=A0AAW1YPG3_RUBAR